METTVGDTRKMYWDDIEAEVAKINPAFHSIVQELAPDKKYPIYKVELPYGALKGDTHSTFLPIKGKLYRLNDDSISPDIQKHLGYGKNSSPLAMILSKSFEYYIDLDDDKVTLPRFIRKPGDIVPLSRIARNVSGRNYAPNGVLSATSGLRSVFMLPQIGREVNLKRMSNELGIKLKSDDSLYSHHTLFSEILNSQKVNSSWRSSILYFSEKWVNKILNDKKWLPVKMHIYEQAKKIFEFDESTFLHNYLYSSILKNRNLRPNPYITDTARHIIEVILGISPGFSPVIDEESLPAHEIQVAFNEYYGLKKYHPTIMAPSHFSLETSTNPVYYSFQYPSTFSFSPKSKNGSSVLSDIRELSDVLPAFIDEFCEQRLKCQDSIFSKIKDNINIQFIHNKEDKWGTTMLTSSLPALDPAFGYDQAGAFPAELASDGKFFRGAVGIFPRNAQGTLILP